MKLISKYKDFLNEKINEATSQFLKLTSKVKSFKYKNVEKYIGIKLDDKTDENIAAATFGEPDFYDDEIKIIDHLKRKYPNTFKAGKIIALTDTANNAVAGLTKTGEIFALIEIADAINIYTPMNEDGFNEINDLLNDTEW